jgi:hypothetical protein
MDTDQEDTRLAELREALRRISPASHTVEIGAKAEDRQLSLDLSDLCIDSMSDWTTKQMSVLATDQINALNLSSLTAIGVTQPNGQHQYTTPSWNFSNDALAGHPGRISLTGEDADIEINGESIVGMLRDIRDQLAILKVSEEMEAEWHELRELRQQYEAKLEECRSKSEVWKTLRNET